jgi:hypothetical protein
MIRLAIGYRMIFFETGLLIKQICVLIKIQISADRDKKILYFYRYEMDITKVFRLRNDKSKINLYCKNCRFRDDHIKGTSHRKVKCDLLQVVCHNN